MRILDDLTRDARYAHETLRRAPAFTAAFLLTLTLGIATATASLSVAHQVLLEPLPVRDEDEIVVLWADNRANSPPHVPLFGTEYRAFARSTRMLGAVAAVDYNGVWPRPIWIADSAGTVATTMVTAELFDVLGVRPIAGRLLRTEDDLPAAAGAVVISEGFWRRAFGGDPSAIGKRIRMPDVDAQIVGVVPAAFSFPRGADVWLPIGRYSRAYGVPSADSLRAYVDIVGRMRPGVARAQVAAEFAAFIKNVPTGMLKDLAPTLAPAVTPLRELVLGDVESPLVVVTVAAVLLLIVTFVSGANLLMVRALAREREFAIRLALGAGRARLSRQIITESVVLATIAAALGIVCAIVALRLFAAFAPAGLPILRDVNVRPSVAIVIVAVATIVVVAFALLPTLITGGITAASALRERVSSGRREIATLRNVLVTAQIAIALCALVAAGIVARSFGNLTRVGLGFDADHILMMHVTPRPGVASGAPGDGLRVMERVAHVIRGVPGVKSATPVMTKPFAGTGGWDFPFKLPGDSPRDGKDRSMLNVILAGPEHFTTFGTRIIAGRAFTDDDRAGSTPVVIVDAALAKLLWPGRDPIGQLISVTERGGKMQRVVGVAEDTRYREFLIPRPTIYAPLRQFTVFPPTYLAVRTTSDASSMMQALAAAVQRVDPTLSVPDSKTMEEFVAAPLATPRLNAFLLGVFATSIVLLATIGVYGLVAAYTRTRRLDIAIRLALGADAPEVTRLVLRQGATMAIAGTLLGAIAAVLGARLLRNVVFGVSPTDPLTLVASIALLFAITLVACWIPARRAAATNPIEALRGESS
jgi:putative ABC transport system permease protein